MTRISITPGYIVYSTLLVRVSGTRIPEEIFNLEGIGP